jgi:putative aldouronate transport system permease protein
MADGMSFSAEQMMALIKQADTANMIKYGVIVLSALPMLIIYPFLQKYFEQGVMIGSVKG